MINIVLLCIGAGLTAIWGIAHLFPTSSVVKGFGEISADNKNIITMEWIVEGVSLIFIGTARCARYCCKSLKRCILGCLCLFRHLFDRVGFGVHFYRFQSKVLAIQTLSFHLHHLCSTYSRGDIHLEEQIPRLELTYDNAK